MTAKKLIKRYLPDNKKIQNNKHLRVFGKHLLSPNLWHLNRFSCARAFVIGIIVAFIPIPAHSLVVALLAILFQANLPICLILIWISNPFTWGPIYYFGYKVGAWILGQPIKTFHFEMSFHWFFHELGELYIPMFLGSLLCGIILGVTSYIGIRVFWRYSVARAWEARTKRRHGSHHHHRK